MYVKYAIYNLLLFVKKVMKKKGDRLYPIYNEGMNCINKNIFFLLVHYCLVNVFFLRQKCHWQPELKNVFFITPCIQNNNYNQSFKAFPGLVYKFRSLWLTLVNLLMIMNM